MNRRKFLSWLGVGAAAVAVAPTALLKMESACAADAAVHGVEIGEYFQYTNFSSFAFASAIDDSVTETAAELAYQAGKSIARLSETAW